SVDAVLVMVPMRRALGTSAMGITEAPLVLIDLHTHEGITGRAYLFCYLESAGHATIALIRDVAAALARPAAPPAALRRDRAAGPVHTARPPGPGLSGPGGRGRRLLGRAGDRRRAAAGPDARRDYAADGRLQQQRAGVAGAAGRRRRSTGTSRRGLPRHQDAA